MYKHIDKPIGPGMFLVKFTLYNPGRSKLSLVKVIKDFTAMGLKESKEFVDVASGAITMQTQYDTPPKLSIYATSEELIKFRQKLNECDSCEYDLTDTGYARNKKLIELGIYEPSELVDELIEKSMIELYEDGFNQKKLREFIGRMYSLLPDDKIKEIYEDTL